MWPQPFCYNSSMSTTFNYLDRFLDPMTAAFTPEMARTIADLRADPATQARVDRLAVKANAGTLTAEEDLEYKSYVEASDIIAIIQSKARRYLANRDD